MHLLLTEPLAELELREQCRYHGSLAAEVGCPICLWIRERALAEAIG